jgi:hypothetical protein
VEVSDEIRVEIGGGIEVEIGGGIGGEIRMEITVVNREWRRDWERD